MGARMPGSCRHDNARLAVASRRPPAWPPRINSSMAASAGLGMMNQLCKVCGEPAAGYHFGAFTCEGCKSFFGRTYNNLTTLGDCKNSGQCVINKKNRTSCKSCRLKKCLMVGMSKSGSRYGRRSNWFKIHCLIQDQSEMSTRLSEQGGVDKEGQYRESTSSSSPDTMELYRGGTPDASPPYDRKENVSFHALPLSPVSPLHHSKFYFQHPTALWTKSLNGFTRKFNMDLGYALPMRMSHNGDFFGDVPEQDIPIDLSVKKSQLGAEKGQCTVVDEPMCESPAEDDHTIVGDKPRVETPLDLTKKELQVD